MASSIGIKIANGEFYPIMEENSSTKKKLILTTVHDNQPSVQIDLFRSAANTMSDAQYIGSLVVENVKPRPKGEPSIEMIISSNSEGEIVADAVDLDPTASGEHYELAVSLKSLDEVSRDMELPDFELDTNEDSSTDGGLYYQASKIRKTQKRSSLLWLFIIIGLVIILGLAAAWLFLLGGLDSICARRGNEDAVEMIIPQPEDEPEPVVVPEPEPEPEPQVQEAVIEVEPVIEPEPPVVIAAPVEPPPPVVAPPQRTRPPPPVASFNVPAVIPREGVAYRIRWGDTLWDISQAFYRTPWLYPKIARHNNIRNPDFIIAGTVIRIPPRN